MILLLIGIIMSIILIAILAFIANRTDGFRNYLAFTLTMLMGAFTAMAIAFFTANAFNWQAAKYKADVINKEYGTNYTREEIFYAGDKIEEIQKSKRKIY